MCLRRERMPQLQERDYPELRMFMKRYGVDSTLLRDFPLELLECIQCINETRIGHPSHLLKTLERKVPIVAAGDRKILDGNHRRTIWRENGIFAGPVLFLETPFHNALSILSHFPRTEFSHGPSETSQNPL